MNTREEILAYGLSFPDTYQNAPFRDPNWQLVRVRNTKKAFLWTYEKDGLLHINVKVDPEWRDFWREAFTAVQPGYHQNKEHWNTVVIDGTVPEDTLKRMIAESYDLVSDSPTQRIYQAVRQIPRGKVGRRMEMSRRWRAILAWRARSEMHCITIRTRNIFHVIALSMRKENWLGHLLLVGKMCRQICSGRME